MSAIVASAQGSHVGTAPATRSGRSPRRSHETRTNFWRVCIVTFFFIVVLSANLFIGGVVLVGGLHTAQTGVGYARIGHITFPIRDGTVCRNIAFDNKTAKTLEDKVSPCIDQRLFETPGRKTRFRWINK